MDLLSQANIVEALIITAGVIITQVAISKKTNNLLMYRLEQLEKKQDKHNHIIERLSMIETKCNLYTPSVESRITQILKEMNEVRKGG